MLNQTLYSGGNLLLDRLTATESSGLLAVAAVVNFDPGDILLDTNETIEHVYFPIDMMVSTTTLMRDGFEVEVGSIGCEGIAGAQVELCPARPFVRYREQPLVFRPTSSCETWSNRLQVSMHSDVIFKRL